MKQTREKGNKPHVVDGRSVDREMASERAIVKPTLGTVPPVCVSWGFLVADSHQNHKPYFVSDSVINN